METLFNKQWFEKTIPGARHDNDMNIISGYRPLVFSDVYGSAGLITRIIELAKLREMQPLFDTFEENTGYRVGQSECTVQELDIITRRAIEFYDSMHSDLNDLQYNLSQCEAELAMIKSGGAGSNGDRVRERAFAANDDKARLTRSIAKTESWCEFISCIILLLDDEIKAWEKDGYKRKCPLPQITTSRSGWYFLQSKSTDARVFMSKLDKLESALKNINSRFTLPVDRYELRRPTAFFNIEASKFYYSREGELMRNILSYTDYIQFTIAPLEKAIQRHQEMKAEFIFTL